MDNVLGVVGGFIAIAIGLAIGVQILGSTSFDCSDLENNTDADWIQACQDVSQQSIGGYELLIIILIVVAAVAILFVVRML